VQALALATKAGHTDTVRVLLSHGAARTTGTRDTLNTPVHLATLPLHRDNPPTELLACLLAHPTAVTAAEVDVANKNGDTPLMFAAATANTVALQLLLSAGCVPPSVTLWRPSLRNLTIARVGVPPASVR
jgi:ankyrin repeat protein